MTKFIDYLNILMMKSNFIFYCCVYFISVFYNWIIDSMIFLKNVWFSVSTISKYLICYKKLHFIVNHFVMLDIFNCILCGQWYFDLRKYSSANAKMLASLTSKFCKMYDRIYLFQFIFILEYTCKLHTDTLVYIHIDL